MKYLLCVLSIFSLFLMGMVSTGISATFTVTNTSASRVRVGSLPWAIYQAQYFSAGPDTIKFNISGSGPFVITLSETLYLGASDGSAIVIDATTQPGYAGSPLIHINANGVPWAFTLINSSGNAIRGLSIYNFSNIGVAIMNTSTSNTIEKNWIGFTLISGILTKTTTLYGGFYPIGVGVASHWNNIMSNVISGVDNGITVGQDPVYDPVQSLTAGANYIYYNIIGGYPDGVHAIGNTSDGIFMGDGAGYNYIGYNNVGAQESSGIELLAPYCFSNHIFQNYVGVGYSNAPLSNHELGILVSNGALYNYIGAYGGNYVAYNGLGGVVLGLSEGTAAWRTTTPAYSNWVIYNYILGDGTVASWNQKTGITVDGYSMDNKIQENSVNGHSEHGIVLAPSYYNYVQYNYIGTSVGNWGYGVFFLNSQFNLAVQNAFLWNAQGTYVFFNSPNNTIY